MRLSALGALALLSLLPVAGVPAIAQEPPGQVAVRSRLHLALQFEQERRFEEALGIFQEVLEAQPGNARAMRGRRTCLLELKRYDELVALLEEQLERFPDDPVALTELGTALAGRGDRERALATWKRIVETQRGSRGAYSTVAGLLKRARMLDEALAVYAEADSAHPGVFRRQKAELHELRFDFEAATSEYLRFLEGNPTALSYVEGRLLRIGESEETLRPVIDRVSRWMQERGGGKGAIGRSNELVFRKLVGDLHLEAGDHAAAGVHYFELARDAPAQFPALLAFGKRCQTDGEHEVAIDVFQRIVRDFPSARVVPSALTEIGRSQQELGRWDDALATFARLGGEYPETDWALAGRLQAGRILRDGKRDPSGAEDAFRELIRRGQGPWGEAEPQLEVAECRVWTGDLDAARAIYRSIQERTFSERTRERALFEEARIAFHQGEAAVADSLCKKVAQEFPRGLRVNDALEMSILINGNEEGPPLQSYSSAMLALRTLDPSSAVEVLEELVAAHPGAEIVDDALLLLGQAHRRAGSWDLALDVLTRAAAEAAVPDLAADARLLRAAILYVDKGDRALALAEYEELLVAYPETLAADRARERSGRLKRVLP